MKKGYIYKLTDGNKFYIGSTSLTLEKRLIDHKSLSKIEKRHSQPVYNYFNSTNWENARMETLRECEYTVKADLLRYEREEYDKLSGNPNCLNVMRSFISEDERKLRDKENAANWHQENKERCKESLQEWRKNNPEKVKEQRQRRVDKAKIEQREYYLANQDKKREVLRQWRTANPEKYAEQRKRSIQQINEKRRLAREAKNNVENNTN